jgi:Zinc-binding dehydrogenase
VITFAFYGRVGNLRLQDVAASKAWQLHRALALIEPHDGGFVRQFFDAGVSRMVPWQRRPHAGRLLAALRDPGRGFQAVVIGEPQRAFYANQFSLTYPIFEHFGVGLWVPEVGGPIDPGSEAHDLAMTLFGSQSKGERMRIKTRVRAAMGAQTALQGRFLGGRPPYGYRLVDAGPIPTPPRRAWACACTPWNPTRPPPRSSRGSSACSSTATATWPSPSGAEVTGVCSTTKVDLVRSIGADEVIDYTRDDFADGAQLYDLIVDTAGNRSLSHLRRALTPGGTLVIIGGEGGGRWLEGFDRQILRAPILSALVGQTLRPLVSKERSEDLVTVKQLIEAGKVTPVIDRTYPLSEAPEAIRHLEEGHARGKIVIIRDFIHACLLHRTPAQ